jgi:acetyl-CoA carboxylase biotin carboxylase subunit
LRRALESFAEMRDIHPIRRILIANRGEIAIRVIRACREMDISPISIFSEVDRTALHVLMADEAYPLGGSAPAESYLNQARILEIARTARADAIHPGYGFLAENPAFANRVEEAGIAFIGPSSRAITLMGDKTEARKTARRLGVRTIRGTFEPLKDEAEALQRASEIGFPLLLKAAAGGGGKGMRVVRSASDMASSFRAAQSEAKTAFGDARVYIEQYLESPRHIEVQVLADRQGNTVYLGERECTIQRRHQKVIEESPSAAVDDALRRTLGEAAVALAKAAGYTNAGTMEFLVDQGRNYHFLEMNTRLQVEHPVTESTTGIDLVKEQICIAEGRELSFTQADVSMRGHAIECRICAEDPENNFLPSTGILARYRPPEGRIRVENGFRQGDEVSVYYDSLLAKVIATGVTRIDAIATMKRALGEFSIEGVKSTVPFCLFVMNHPAFTSGNIDTGFVDKHYSTAERPLDADQVLAAAVTATLLTNTRESEPGRPVNHDKSQNNWKLRRQELLQ